MPPSLQNIFKELQDDLGHDSLSGDLTKWADQVLLLNSVLSVERVLRARIKGKVGSFYRCRDSGYQRSAAADGFCAVGAQAHRKGARLTQIVIAS